MSHIRTDLRWSFKQFHYLRPRHMRRELRELFYSATILNFGLNAVMLFEPLYLWELGYSLQKILLYWALVYGGYLLLLPLGAKFTNRIGYEPGIFFGTIFWVGYLAALYALRWWDGFFWIAPLCYAIQKSVYWQAFDADFAKSLNKQEEGEEVGDLQVVSVIMSVVAPIFGGLIVSIFGFGWLFAAAGMLMMGSNYFLLRTHERFKSRPFDYFYPWKRLFQGKDLRTFFAYLGYGEELVLLAIWPIFIFVVMKDFVSTGVVAAVTALVTAIVTFLVGKASNHEKRFWILRLGSVMYALTWFLKIFVAGYAQLFLVDALSQAAKNVVAVPMSVITFDKAKNHTIMNTIVYAEFSLVIGKLVAALVMFVLLFFVDGFTPIFIVAGLMTFLYALLK